MIPMTAWEELGSLAQKPTAQSATYQSQTLDVMFLDRPARAFVDHSRGLDKKKRAHRKRSHASTRD